MSRLVVWLELAPPGQAVPASILLKIMTPNHEEGLVFHLMFASITAAQRILQR
jgi:hypothetical protein